MTATVLFARSTVCGMVSKAAEGLAAVRVLVVDDYQPFAGLLAGVLCNEGYDVREAHSAKEALKAMEEFRPDAVVLDVILGDFEGFGFAAKFAQRFPWCRVLLMSAWDFELAPTEELKGRRVVPNSLWCKS